MEDFIQTRLAAIGEAILGTAVMTSHFWGTALDRAASGAHIIAVFTGAVVGIHGFIRLVRTRRSRRKDDRV